MSALRLRPVIYLIVLNIIGFSLLFLFKQPYDVNILYAGLMVCAINIGVYCLMYFLDLGDVYLFLMVSILVSLGIIMLVRLDLSFGYAQVVWFCIGIIVFFVAYMVMRLFKWWDRLSLIYMIVSVLLFAATLLLGTSSGGSRNWILIGGRGVQPSEFIKITYAFTLACFFSGRESCLLRPEKQLWSIDVRDIVLAGFVYICLGFLVLQREWGTAVLFFLMYFTMLVLYDANVKLLILNETFAVIGSVGGYFLTPHIKVRVSTWLDPWADAGNRGFQITQSLFAITSGGYFGTGIGNGNPYFIPEVHSDFIFAAMCEEMGVFTGIAVILIYFIFSYRGFKIALAARDEFLRALTFALTISFAFQTFIIVGGVIKLIPLTGITMPFVSYGGSSMVSCFLMLGLLTGVSFLERRR